MHRKGCRSGKIQNKVFERNTDVEAIGKAVEVVRKCMTNKMSSMILGVRKDTYISRK